MTESFLHLPLFFWIVILVALAFDFANGWNDTANAVATVISTRVLRPGTAILLSAVLNFIGALLSTKVAKTVGGGIINPTVVQGVAGSYVILAAMLGAVAWVAITTLKGLPISGSHSLIGGLIGAAVTFFGWQVVVTSGVLKVLVAMLLSPFLGLVLGYAVLKGCYWAARWMRPFQVKKVFSWVQIGTASAMSLMHGQNDAQKVMGVITLLLFTGGYFGAVEFKQVEVPVWVMLACATAMALGTATGGQPVIKTLGSRLSHLRPIEGAAAESSASIVLEAAAVLGVPVSTTHTITGSIVGVGTAKRMKAVKWATGFKIVYAWVFTLPITAALAAGFAWVIRLLVP